MNASPSILRPLLAWLLLLMMTYQQVVGRLYVSVVYSVEIESAMTETERVIAHILKEKVGIETEVKIYDEDQPRPYNATGYGAPFVISEEVDGEVYSFTIDDKPAEFVHHTYISKLHHFPEDLPNSRTLLIKLFSGFYLDATSLFHSTPTRKYQPGVFAALQPALDFDPAIPYPPPRQV